MDINGILEAEDRLFNENRADEVEGLLMGAISVALEEQDGYALLQLLNELIGYYRESSKFEESYKVADEILNVAGQILPEKSAAYATSLLNIATAYRTGGRLQDSEKMYKRVEEIYDEILAPDDLLRASFYNNESLLYQEMGDFEKSKICLKNAIEIVVAAGKLYEEAVSRANLAGTCMQLNELDEGFIEATKAIDLFTELRVNDGHYAAALSALGSYHYIKGEFEAGAQVFKQAMEAMEMALGKNAYYSRLEENYRSCLEAYKATGAIKAGDEKSRGKEADSTKGMELCYRYYVNYGAKMLEELFRNYVNQIAVGLAGEGSDCYGFDDEISRDHDWGPDFCIWVTDETYEEIGEALEKAYDELPEEFEGFKRAKTVQGNGRRGVIKISQFCKRLLGCELSEDRNIREQIDWTTVTDAGLSAFVNGEIWNDPQGIISGLRAEVSKGYPERIKYLKIAEAAARFSQTGQYNYKRCLERGDTFSADIMKADCIREAMKLEYYIQNAYPPHDKWLLAGLNSVSPESVMRLKELSGDFSEENIEKAGMILAMNMYQQGINSDIDPYLDHHTEELLMKSGYCSETDEELAMHIAKVEFEAFDKVVNEGGRASCQNDWPTFNIMRRSQYLTWTRDMLLQYLYDFEREYRMGHNLITEKYGRMMASTAPDRYDEIKDNFPEVSEEKQSIIEAVCQIQVGWMDEFAAEYPALAGQARSIHTGSDASYNTSYETYLRGEISTYSDKMLELYTRFIIGLSREGKNLARMTMENSCRLYGYKSLEDAERFQKL